MNENLSLAVQLTQLMENEPLRLGIANTSITDKNRIWELYSICAVLFILLIGIIILPKLNHHKSFLVLLFVFSVFVWLSILYIFSLGFNEWLCGVTKAKFDMHVSDVIAVLTVWLAQPDDQKEKGFLNILSELWPRLCDPKSGYGFCVSDVFFDPKNNFDELNYRLAAMVSVYRNQVSTEYPKRV